ncbi:D-alanyl-D-alanine carboxypeptidase/D-alanyl-D-alanine endopeptidase [Brevibacillus dissolubilis]|uniref:D-alanyl-D-alanine carboxypeptidase/D-alanyl-D-alanine endopeptidase n=1 Tax=Brevibacillus dissolubilis TaxID=1844116 RepID=UPI00111664EA|nr:D-alanyl-D-alanine carboxypeptidase/D-alanyl-D-alanine-endopeptidase [Brevibacillus dissolubilis]
MVKTKGTMFKLLLSTLLIGNMVAVPVYAAEPTTASGSALLASVTAIDPLTAQFEQSIIDLAKDVNSLGINPGIAVYNLTQGKYLYKHHQDRTFVPASNLKLFVAATALDQLGPTYQFKTEVYTDGEVKEDGVLKGNLTLKGYGDPSFAPEDLTKLVKHLKEQGINEIHGDLLLDESYFDDVRLGPSWMWDDEPWGYSAQISALALHKNFITLSINPDQAVGQKPSITMAPQNDYVTVVNQVKIVEGEDDNITIERPRGQNVIIIKGTLGKAAGAYEEDVTMEDPTLFVGNVLKKELAAQGIKLQPTAKISKTVLTKGVPFYIHYSRPLSDIIMELNKDSDNFFAEVLLKNLGAVEKGEGSFEKGGEVVAEFMQEAGINGGFRYADGSGLSRMNFVSPDQMLKLLIHVQGKEYKELFEKSLPIAGVDGTLKSRMKNTPAANNLIAKTGSMGGVNTISGYVTAKNGDKLAFSILINGIYKSKYARDFQDKLGILMATYPELKVPAGYKPVADKTYELSKLLDPIIDQAQMKGVTTGVIVKSLDRAANENVLYERDADRLLTPASNLKLLTSATALQKLGKDYRYPTEIYLSQKVTSAGVLNGDVIVKGYGDPSLHTEDSLKVQEGISVEEIAAVLKENGIKRMNGNLIMDDTYFDNQRLGLGWAWDDESYYYNALIGALSINRGTVMIDYAPAAQAGEPVKVELFPKTSYVQVINESKTVGADEENTFAIERERGKNIIHIKGNLPIDASADYERVPVEEPAYYTGTVLKEKMQAAGIQVSPKSTVKLGTAKANAIKLTTLESEPLSDIVTYLNKKSDNFYAEMLLKKLGAAPGKPGSADAGAAAVQTWLQSLGVSTSFDMIDGSGLTRYNLISPRHINSVLEVMTKQSNFETYYSSLPIAGVDGTLSSRMKDTAAAGNVHAKTGTLTGVSSLSGYVTTKDGEKLVFSIMMNGYTDKAANLTAVQNQLAVALASYQKK